MVDIDRRIQAKLAELNDIICMNTGQKGTFIFIPHQGDKGIKISINGKPVSSHRADGGIPPEEALSLAMGERRLSKAKVIMRQIKETLDEV